MSDLRWLLARGESHEFGETTMKDDNSYMFNFAYITNVISIMVDTSTLWRTGGLSQIFLVCLRTMASTIDNINRKIGSNDNLLVNHPLVEIAHLWELLDQIPGTDDIGPEVILENNKHDIGVRQSVAREELSTVETQPG